MMKLILLKGQTFYRLIIELMATRPKERQLTYPLPFQMKNFHSSAKEMSSWEVYI